MKRVHQVIAEIEPHDSVEPYTSLGVEVIQGYAKIIDPWTVEIQKTRWFFTALEQYGNHHCGWSGTFCSTVARPGRSWAI